MPMRPWLLAIAVPVLAANLGGCRSLRFLNYLFAPNTKETVKPEYAALPGTCVAVVVYTTDKIQAEHHDIQRDVSLVVTAELKDHVKDLTVVEPQRILKYQRENLFWFEMDKTKLGKDLGAGYVLYVSLEEFSTVAPGTLQLYQGRLMAQASLFKTDLPERDSRVWGPKEFRIVHPEVAPSANPAESDASIRYATVTIFADQLSKKFYEYTIEETQ